MPDRPTLEALLARVEEASVDRLFREGLRQASRLGAWEAAPWIVENLLRAEIARSERPGRAALEGAP